MQYMTTEYLKEALSEKQKSRDTGIYTARYLDIFRDFHNSRPELPRNIAFDIFESLLIEETITRFINN